MTIKNHTGKEDTPFPKPVDENNYNESDNPYTGTGDAHTVLTLLLSNSKELYILLDRSYNILYINKNAKTQFATIFNIELQKGQNLLKVASEKNRPFVQEIYEDVLKDQTRETESSHQVNGQTIYLRNIFRPAKNEQGEIVGIIINTQDITDYKRNQIALEEAGLLWQFASEGSNQGLFDWNIQTGYTYYSKSYKRLYGFDDDEIENYIDEWSSRVHPDDRKITSVALESHFTHSEPTYDSSYRIKDKSGNYRWILSRGVIVSRDENGRPLRMIGTHTDITRYKITEANYKLLFYSNPLPMWTLDPDTLCFLEVNDRAVEHYGYSREEFLKMTVKDIHPPEETLDTNISFKNVSQDTHFVLSGIRHQKKDGTNIFVDITAHIIEQDGKNICLITCLDVTDKLLAEQRLQNSEMKYRMLFVNNPLPSWIYNPATQQLLEVNEAAVSHYGYTKEEFKQLTIRELHPIDERAAAEKDIAEAREKNTNIGLWRHQKKNGEIIYVEIRSSKIEYLNQIARLVVIHNKTNEVKAEKELLESNERFQLATLASSEVLWEWNLLTNEMYVSDALTKLFGWEVKNKHSFGDWHQYIHPDDKARALESFSKALANPSTERWEREYRFLKTDGSYATIVDKVFIQRSEHGNAIKVVGAIQDISLQKQIEESLRISNERFQLASKATSDAIWDLDLSQNTLEWGEGLTSLFGYNREEVPYEKWMTLVHPEDLERVRSSMEAAINDQEQNIWNSQYRFKAADNTYRYVLDRGFILRDAQKQPCRFIGSIQDITDLKIKEKQLTESNERFDAVLKATNDLIWDWNLETGQIYRDAGRLQKVYGIANEADIKNMYDWLQRIHPDDSIHVQSIINEILHSSNQDNFEAEYRFRRDDNRYNFVYDRGIILRNTEGRPVRMIGAAQNITERKRLEVQLLKKELDKQKLISQATIETQEQERSEIGKELHDNVNQVLTTTKLYLDLSISNADLKDELILKSSQNIIYVINEIRQLSRSLMNPSLGDLGLTESILELIDNVKLTGRLTAQLHVDSTLEKSLSENQKLMVYRIVQEAINNALKHAKAKNVQISVQDQDQWVELFIKDDGIGFNFATVKKGSGLKHIQNRVYLANGTLTVTSAPGEGCLIMINFPKHTNPI